MNDYCEEVIHLLLRQLTKEGSSNPCTTFRLIQKTNKCTDFDELTKMRVKHELFLEDSRPGISQRVMKHIETSTDRDVVAKTIAFYKEQSIEHVRRSMSLTSRMKYVLRNI